MTDAVRTAEQRIPYLSDIPFVGKLFRSKRQDSDESNEKVETLFFITVTMVDTEGQPTGRLADGRTIHNPRAAKNKKAEAAKQTADSASRSEVKLADTAATSPSETDSSLPSASSPEVQKIDSASTDITESQIAEEASASRGA
jgi:type II secretory pathway component GspD/PulD (secretin)